MSHVRQQLRDALITVLTGLTTTGSRVSTAHVYPLGTGETPALAVNTVAETATPLTIHPNGLVERDVVVEIEGFARGTSGLAALLDTIASEVETALGSSVTVSGHLVPLNYTGAQIDFSGEIDQPVGRISIRYSAVLFTAANAPDTLMQA